MIDDIPIGSNCCVPEHVIDPFGHYDECDDPAVFVTVAEMSHAAPYPGDDHDAVEVVR